jgi:hypothetical protein
MPFATVAVPHAAYRDLPTPQHRWLLMCLARYADRDGRCWPSMRQLADDARMSLATVCRYLKSMADLGVFHRGRKGVGRYRYQLAEAYVPRWPGRVSSARSGVPQDGTKQADHCKQDKISRNHAYQISGNFVVCPNKNHDKNHQTGSSVRHEDKNYIFHDDSSQWRARLAAWERSGGRFWISFWGPKPDEPGYWGPATAT